MRHGHFSQAHAAETAATGSTGTSGVVIIRRPLPRPRRPAAQVPIVSFDTLTLADVDWYQVALWWRDLYFMDTITYQCTECLAASWRDSANGWRALYYDLLASVSPTPLMPPGAGPPTATYEPSRARSRSRAPRPGAGATPY